MRESLPPRYQTRDRQRSRPPPESQNRYSRKAHGNSPTWEIALGQDHARSKSAPSASRRRPPGACAGNCRAPSCRAAARRPGKNPDPSNLLLTKNPSRRATMQVVGIMLVRNEDRFLRRSALNILEFCDRILIADHQSQDGTAEICAELAAISPKFEVYRIRDPRE